MRRIIPAIDEALRSAGVCLDQLTAVAVTSRPGLVGSLLVGLTAAKTLALALDLPLVDVSHVEAHLYACRMSAGRDVFPAVGLVVSGGHTLLYDCASAVEFHLLGSTIDDAAGEAFDKGAKLLGLGYPGGPAIQKAAGSGNSAAVRFPRPLLDAPGLDFSFSGLKTALLYEINGSSNGRSAPRGLSLGRVADLAASYQEAIVDVLVAKCRRAPSGQSEMSCWSAAESRPMACCGSDWPRWPARRRPIWCWLRQSCAPITRPWPHWPGSSSIDRFSCRLISMSHRASCEGRNVRRGKGVEPAFMGRRCWLISLAPRRRLSLTDERESEDVRQGHEAGIDGEAHVSEVAGDDRGGRHRDPFRYFRNDWLISDGQTGTPRSRGLGHERDIAGRRDSGRRTGYGGDDGAWGDRGGNARHGIWRGRGLTSTSSCTAAAIGSSGHLSAADPSRVVAVDRPARKAELPPDPLST